jgi:hypothetical protein
MAFELIQSKAHLTAEGLAKVVSIKASMNWGISVRSELKAAFPNTFPVVRPLIQNLPIPNPQWVAGFVDGEACFFC